MRPTVSVSMPTRNVGHFLGQAIASVLSQEGVDLELLVVDDASTDSTPEVVRGFRDERLRYLRNERWCGIGASHNRALEVARGAYVAHVDSDDLLLPNALAQMVKALEEDPAAGLAHCYFFDIDAEGRTSENEVVQRWVSFRRSRPPGMDYRELASHEAGIFNHLRTYRREALEETGAFDTDLRFAVDYDMSLRLLENWSARLVPEFLYARRVHASNASEAMRWRAARVWWQKVRVRRRVVRRGQVSYLRGNQIDLGYFLAAQRRRRGKRRESRRRRRRIAVRRWRWHHLAATQASLYSLLTSAFPRWPLGGGVLEGPRRHRSASGPIAYSLSAFPALSETFIQREVQALLEAGLDLRLMAEAPLQPELYDERAAALRARTRYHRGPFVDAHYPRALRRLGIRRAGPILRCYLFAVLHRHHAEKRYERDRRVFRRSVVIAARMLELEIGHIHAPWGDAPATSAMLAARMIGARFTMQVRAFDLHRRPSNVGMQERLLRAAEVLTNSRYNARLIEKRTGGRVRPTVIYNGLDLRRFPRDGGKRSRSSTLQVLCVARIVPQKGIEDLLRCWRLLVEAGHEHRLEIVGGTAKGREDYAARMRALCAELQLTSHVEFTGPLPFEQVLSRYRQADVVVLAALVAPDGARDVTPNTLLEAMASQVPVVATHCGAIPEIVEDGSTGLLVAPGDPAALADAILRLRDPRLRAEMGAAGRRLVEERFDISKNVHEYLRAFGSKPNAPASTDSGSF